jgi:hypothetical protein
MANWAAGNSGVGPGVKRRVFRIMFSPRLGPVTECRAAGDPASNHIIHICVVFVNFTLCKSSAFRPSIPSAPK